MVGSAPSRPARFCKTPPEWLQLSLDWLRCMEAGAPPGLWAHMHPVHPVLLARRRLGLFLPASHNWQPVFIRIGRRPRTAVHGVHVGEQPCRRSLPTSARWSCPNARRIGGACAVLVWRRRGEGSRSSKSSRARNEIRTGGGANLDLVVADRSVRPDFEQHVAGLPLPTNFRGQLGLAGVCWRLSR